MSSSKSMEGYYQKVIQLQEKLRQSEEERLKLEMKYNEMIQHIKEEEEAHLKKIRMKYKEFLEDDRRRQQRNDKILDALERIESRSTMWDAKTKKFKAFRKRFQHYLKPNYEIEAENVSNYLQKSCTPKPEDKYSNLGNINSIYRKAQDDGTKTSKDFQNSLKQNKKFEDCSLRQQSSEEVHSELKRLLNEDESSNIWKPEYEFYSTSKDKMIEKSHVSSLEEKDCKNKLLEDVPKTDALKSVDSKQNAQTTKGTISNDLTQILQRVDYDETERKDSLKQRIDESMNVFEQNKNQGQPFLQVRNQHYDESGVSVKRCDEVHTQPGKNEKPIQVHEKINHQPLEERYDESEQNNRPISGPLILQHDHTNQPTCQYDENVQSFQGYDENNQVTPQRNESGQSIQQNDANQLISPYDESSQLFPQYNDNNQPISQYEERGQSSQQNDQSNEPTSQYDETVYEESYKPISQYDEKNKLISQNDKSAEFQQYDENNQPTPQYEETSQSFQQYEESYKPIPQYDEKNNQLISQNESAQSFQQYDESNQPTPQFEESGQSSQQNQPNPQYDETGQSFQLYDESNQPIPQYDEGGQFFQQYDENNQPIPQYDESAQSFQQYDENNQPQCEKSGQSFQQNDENNQPISQYDEGGQLFQQYDENNQPIPQYDENGQSFQQYDENNQPTPQYEESGQPILQYDESGQPILQYDQQYNANGEEIPYYTDDKVQYYDQSGEYPQYDENGQLIPQYDENGQALQQYYDQYDENGQFIQYEETAEENRPPDPATSVEDTLKLDSKDTTDGV
ncbi:hypothetical protein RN001_000235 [Aquatica leii]|uniref:Uncharacterized protein n=1 Tax=Aquatica leii TaxID=1421715 RepID=A0AAN7SKE8_9COLE|nr:hypothetical protein RN001_000235 [Aquatica leii]